MIIRNLSILLLMTGCMRNEGLSTMAMTQENIWNLSRLEIGMKKREVGRIMHDPYKTRVIVNDSGLYNIWFYVTRPSTMDQSRLVRKNVTPLVFADGVLQGWGFEYYDKVLNNKIPVYQYYEYEEPSEEIHLEKAIQELESRRQLSQNEAIESVEGDEYVEEECPPCRPKKPHLRAEDEEMIEEANEQNFNFW